MTALNYHSGRYVDHRRSGPRRAGAATVKIITTADIVLRPVLISLAIVVAATVWAGQAHADPIDSSYPGVLSNSASR